MSTLSGSLPEIFLLKSNACFFVISLKITAISMSDLKVNLFSITDPNKIIFLT